MTVVNVPPPASPIWTLAVHHAGHCVVAHLLGLRVSRVKVSESGLCDVAWHRGDERSGDVVESDALVALAGVAAQWLYRQGSVRAVHVRRDDAMASVVLRQVERDDVVEASWREYLRQRALRIVSEPRNQLLIARLAGLIAGRERAEGREIHAFLDREALSVRALLSDPETTLEERVGLLAHRTFAIPIERLGLGSSLARVLRHARIPTLGRLLQYSAADLAAIVSSDAAGTITNVLAARDLELASHPRSNVRELYFSAEAICEQEERCR